MKRTLAIFVILMMVLGFEPPNVKAHANIGGDRSGPVQVGCPATGVAGKSVGRDYFAQVLGQLPDVDLNDFAIDAMVEWQSREATNAFWNPLATTWKMSPVCNFNSVGVQNYLGQDAGVQATANTLALGYYDAIRAMLGLRAFDREGIRASLGTWGTCKDAGCDSLLREWQLGFDGYSNPQPSVASTFSVLVVDTSGSMNDPDAGGDVKLDAAKKAGRQLLSIIDAEIRAGGTGSHQVAVVDFSDNATVDMLPTADISAAQTALEGLYPTGGTAMPKGMRAALDLPPPQAAAQAFMILLSDGLPNIGLNDESGEEFARPQSLDLALEAGRRGFCIYTVGFGDPASGSIDEAFLKQIASNSGCGEYHSARDAWELAAVYIGLRHSSTGTTLLSRSGSIDQGQLLAIGDVQVPDNQSMVLFTLNWPGSFLDAILRDPKGQQVDTSYPGASITVTDTLASIIVRSPAPGQWSVLAEGVDVPTGSTSYNAVLSVRANPNPPPATPIPTPVPVSDGGFPLAVIIIVVSAVGVVVYAMIVSGRRSRQSSGARYIAPAALTGMTGHFAGRSIPLVDGMLIGRGSACTLRLDDPSVSRRHAQILYGSGRWFIRDQNSQVGVYVNGVRVQSMALNRGDRIRIGRVEFVFN